MTNSNETRITIDVPSSTDKIIQLSQEKEKAEVHWVQS